MKKNAWEWDEQDLIGLITLQVQENIELDYKQCDALQKTDGKKNEISKDVSAFANSAGGVLVYGMKENGHKPTAIDAGYDPTDISKEWLEQVINSRIQRRISGVRVNQVNLVKTAPGKVAYVISIPQSSRAPHQAADKKFYKRYNFESIPMEEYEIRDVAHRSSTPDIEVNFAFGSSGATTELQKGEAAFFNTVDLVAVISNTAATPAEFAVFDLFIDERITIVKLGSDVRKSSCTETVSYNGKEYQFQRLTYIWGRNREVPIFEGIRANIPSEPLIIAIPIGPDIFFLRYIVGSPGMTTKDKVVLVTVKGTSASIDVVEKNKGANPRST